MRNKLNKYECLRRSSEQNILLYFKNEFEQLIPEAPKNLIDFAKKLDLLENIFSYDDIDFFNNFFINYENKSINDYTLEFEKQIDFFKNSITEIIEPKIIEYLHSNEYDDISDLIDYCLNKNQKNNFIFGTYFLISTLIKERPDLINSNLFKFSIPIEKYSILIWILSQALHSNKILHLEPLLSNQYLEIFLPILLISENINDLILIFLIFLIYKSFINQKVFSIKSEHFVQLLHISKRISTSKDNYISNIINLFIKEIQILDYKNLPKYLMEFFPDAPEFVSNIFIKEININKNVTFIDGWIESHYNHKRISMIYIECISNKIPKRIVCKFPLNDLKFGDNRIKLILLEVELTNSSFRFLFLILLILIIIYKFMY